MFVFCVARRRCPKREVSSNGIWLPKPSFWERVRGDGGGYRGGLLCCAKRVLLGILRFDEGIGR